MKILLLTPGTGHFFCGSCLRDNHLSKGLRSLGHDVSVVPLYLPLVLESEADHAAEEPLQMGGINMYLQQKSGLARLLPRFVANLLDHPKLLRWASRRGNLTEAPDLGPMTVSMLQGEHGRQRKEVEKLVESVAARDRPDVIILSNVMLTGIVHRLKEVVDRPVIVTTQGEAPFLDALPAPFAEQSWEILRERTAELDALVPVSLSYGEVMRERLGIDAARVHVVYNGIELSDFASEPAPIASRKPKSIGYLARICRDKGVHTLVDAFVLLAERDRIPDLRLRIAGTMLKGDRPLVDELRNRLQASGCAHRVEFLPNVPRADKLDFLGSLAVLSVPATYGESFGLYLLEAMAAGVPVVQPRHAAFPELIEATGGGVLCEPDDPASLADGLEALLLDESRSQELATRGRASVFANFTAERMALEFEAVCRSV